MSHGPDCTNVGKLVKNREKMNKFQLVYQLTILEWNCLKQIQNSENRSKYPKEQEKILFGDIKRGLINLKPDLITVDPENLKYIGVILRDYDTEGDVSFNKFLISSLLESYRSIAETFSKYPKWEKTINNLEKDKQIQRHEWKQPLAEEYLKLRKDVDSLYTIISKFDDVNVQIQELKQTERNTKEFDLALQRLFHVAGEYLKGTIFTPNLSGTIRESLMDQGVPVEVLNEFRDTLAHKQLFPLIDSGKEKIEQLLVNDFSPIINIMKDEIAKMEKSYIHEFITKKQSEVIPDLKPFFDNLLKDCEKGIRQLFQSIQQIQTETSKKSKNKAKSKLVAELYQTVIQMKSKDFSDVKERQSSETKPGSSITDYIIENKLKTYKELHGKLESWAERDNVNFQSLLSTKDRVLEIIEVMLHLNYGGTPLPKDVFDNFIRTEDFEKLAVESGTGTLKEELEKYFTPDDFSAGYDWSIPKNRNKKNGDGGDLVSLEDVTNMLIGNGETAESKKLLSFLQRFYVKFKTVSLTADQYKNSVNNLKVNRSTRNYLLSFSQDEQLRWNLPEGTKYEDFVNVLQNIGSKSKSKSAIKSKTELINFFNSLIDIRSSQPFTANEYKSLVDNLKLENKAYEATLHSFSVGWRKKECARLLKDYKYSPDLMKIYDAIIQGEMDLIPDKYNKLESEIQPLVKELYGRRVEEEIQVLGDLKNVNAVESGIINIYSLLNNAKMKSKGKKPKEKGKGDFRKLRNLLSHGDALMSIDDLTTLSVQLDSVKRDVVNELNKIIETGGETIDITRIEGVLDKIDEVNAGISRIKDLLCPRGDSRPSRNIHGCLTREDIEKVVDGRMETIDPDIIKIDSEKLMDTLSNEEMDVEKFFNYIALAAECEVEGAFKHDISTLTTHHEYFNKHMNRVQKFSGYVMHAMIFKDIVRDLVRHDYAGVAIDLGFLGGSLGGQVIAKFVALKGAGFVAKGSVVLGRSLKLASPFISRGVSAFIAYDLWNQVKEYKSSGSEDAYVSIVGDGVMLAVEAAEIGVEIAELYSVIAGVSVITGPLGMFVVALVMLGTEIYHIKRAVDRIDEKIHLTGAEKIGQGLAAIVGAPPPQYLQYLIEEKDGNNAAVQDAIKMLKDNPHIKRSVFPSYIHADGKLKRASNCYVQLGEKVNIVGWIRSMPDDVAGVNLFCKPVGEGPVGFDDTPPSPVYYCKNVIGVEYTDARTGNYTFINLGEGYNKASGFLESSNIFVINQEENTFTGGYKDDTFMFHVNQPTHKTYGSIDGLGGRDTLDVGGFHHEEFDTSTRRRGRYKFEEMVADFPAETLNYGEKVDISIKNINSFEGMPRRRDRVTAACDTMFVNGNEGGEEEQEEDVVNIPFNESCSYNTTIAVGINTRVTNDATDGDFKYFINGEKGQNAYINITAKSFEAKNLFVFDYTIEDVAAINRYEENNVKFSFVEDFYETFNHLDYEHSFNLTVSGGVENIYLLSDNTRIVVGENHLYALHNTNMSIYSIVQEYSDIMRQLQMIGIVRSRNEVLTIGGSNNDVINNDPSAEMSHFVSGAGENIFSFTSGLEKLALDNFFINEVTIHYFNKLNSIDTLDLRHINEQVKNDLGKEMQVNLSGNNDDLFINLSFDDGGKHKTLMTIILRDILDYVWYSTIHVVLDVVFVIEKWKEGFRLVPRPLIFDDDSYTLYVINPKDVAKDTKIKVFKELGSYNFALDGDALIITNVLSSDAYKRPLATVILNEFFKATSRDKMQSLEIEFDDKTFQLSKETNGINGARSFLEVKSQVLVDNYLAMVTAMKRTRGLFAANLAEAKRIIDRDNEIVLNKDGWMNPLVYASSKGIHEIVEYLVNKGADVKVKDSSGHSSVYYAVRNEHHDVADFLLSKLFNDGDRGMVAITAELAVVRYIVEIKGNDFVNAPMIRYKSTLLHYAAMNGNLDVVRYLIEEVRGALKGNFRARDRFDQTPLYYAVKYRHAAVVDYLGQTIRKEGGTPLCFAAQTGRLDIVKYLIDKRGADIYEKDNITLAFESHSPLFYALQNLHNEVVDYLRQIITREGEGQLLAYTVITGDVDVARLLIKLAEPVNDRNIHGKTALHYAAIYCNMDMGNLLLENGALIDVQDASGHTPVYFALNQKLRGGHNDSTCNIDSLLSTLLGGQDLLLFGIKVSELAIVKHMTKTTADLNRTDPETKQTLLHLAVMNPRVNLEMLVYLIEQGLDPNAKDFEGKTPLHFAAMHATTLNAVKYLVEHGADVNAKDNNGVKPVIFAKGNSLVVNYLTEKMNARKRRDLDNNLNDEKNRLNSIPNGNVGQESNLQGIGQFGRAHNAILSWVKSSFSGLLNPEIDETRNSSFPGVVPHIDAHGTIMLLDLLIRKITGQKYISTVERVKSPLEIQGYALNIVEIFEEVLNETALESGIPAININFNPLAMQSAVIKHEIYGKSSETPKLIYSFAEKACPEFEPTDVFLKRFKNNLEHVLEQRNELLLPKSDHITNRMFSKNYEVAERTGEAETFRKLGNNPFNSLNQTSSIQNSGLLDF